MMGLLHIWWNVGMSTRPRLEEQSLKQVLEGFGHKEENYISKCYRLSYVGGNETFSLRIKILNGYI